MLISRIFNKKEQSINFLLNKDNALFTLEKKPSYIETLLNMINGVKNKKQESYFQILALMLIDFSAIHFNKINWIIEHNQKQTIIYSFFIDEVFLAKKINRFSKLIDIDFFVQKFAICFNGFDIYSKKTNIHEHHVLQIAEYFADFSLNEKRIFLDNKKEFDSFSLYFKNKSIQISLGDVKNSGKFLLNKDQMNVLCRLNMIFNSQQIPFLSILSKSLNDIVNNSYFRSDLAFRNKYAIESSESLFQNIGSALSTKKFQQQITKINQNILQINHTTNSQIVFLIKNNVLHIFNEFFNGQYDEDEFSQAFCVLPVLIVLFYELTNIQFE